MSLQPLSVSEAEEHGAKANVMTKVEYSGYAIDSGAPVVVRVVEALGRIGITATFESTMGGSDAISSMPTEYQV